MAVQTATNGEDLNQTLERLKAFAGYLYTGVVPEHRPLDLKTKAPSKKEIFEEMATKASKK